MTVKQLLATTDSNELAEWMALRRVEIEEQRRTDLATKARASEEKLRSKSKWRR